MTFSLRSLILAVGVLAVAVWLLAAAPSEAAVPGLVAVAAANAVMITAGMFYGRDHTRAFCAGAAFPAGATIVALTLLLFLFLCAGTNIKDFPSLFRAFADLVFPLRVWSGASWLLEIALGLLAVAMRSGLTQHARPDEQPPAVAPPCKSW